LPQAPQDNDSGNDNEDDDEDDHRDIHKVIHQPHLLSSSSSSLSSTPISKRVGIKQDTSGTICPTANVASTAAIIMKTTTMEERKENIMEQDEYKVKKIMINTNEDEEKEQHNKPLLTPMPPKKRRKACGTDRLNATTSSHPHPPHHDACLARFQHSVAAVAGTKPKRADAIIGSYFEILADIHEDESLLVPHRLTIFDRWSFLVFFFA
jgi:hypothetical protein